MNFSRFGAAVSVIAISACLLPQALAQSADQASALQDDETVVLSTVTVTSTKKAESQQDVGLTVAAFSGDDIRDLGVDDIESLSKLVPGMGIYDRSGGGVPVIIIRGVGLQNFRINDSPATAVYVDEVYQTTVAEAAATIFDVERVEVLKGPQGGLYGRNAVGGAIQVISARPNFDKYEGYASVKYEEYDRREGELVVTGPITDKLAFRLGGKVIQGGGVLPQRHW